jgi:polyisoprenoid-binding protein YceI
MIKKVVLGLLIACAMLLGPIKAIAADYKVDPTHSFINFKVSHLGFSWLLGRFNKLSGELNFDPTDPQASTITVLIDTTSLDSNHSERNIHLKGEKYLDVETYPEAKFVSTSYRGSEQGGTLSGKLTLHGVTNDIKFDIKKVGEGDDPWGGYRAGFEGSITLKRTDFGMESNLGPLANDVYLDLFIEGVREK